MRWGCSPCGTFGHVSVAGVYGGFVDTFPIGAVVNRALTMKVVLKT